MNSVLYSGTDLALSSAKSERLGALEHNTWTIHDAGRPVHVLPNTIVSRTKCEHNVTDWETPQIKVFHYSKSQNFICEFDQISVPAQSGRWSAPDPVPVSGLFVFIESAGFSPPQLEFAERTTTEPWREATRDVSGLLPIEIKGSEYLSNELRSIFELAALEDFEDGVETEFSREVGRFIERYSIAAIDTIRTAMDQNLYRDTYVAEALLWIGDLEDDETANARRTLLENACWSESASLRDAAITGLSYLGAFNSIRHLERRLDVERVKGVRANIEAILAYLRD